MFQRDLFKGSYSRANKNEDEMEVIRRKDKERKAKKAAEKAATNSEGKPDEKKATVSTPVFGGTFACQMWP